MAYRRVISYIYAYEKGKRTENTGFVKLEVKDKECKISIRLKISQIRGQVPYQAYFFIQEDDKIQRNFLGEMEVGDGSLEWRGTVQVDMLPGTPYGLPDTAGVYLEGSGRFYAAEWEDRPVEIERFQTLEIQEESEGEMEDTILETTNLEEAKKEIESLSEPEPESKPEKEFQTEQEQESVPPIPRIDSRQEKWEYLAEHFPPQNLYWGGKNPLSCIRIGPRDLRRIPSGSWILGNNSFLLHGYYQYRHLLLCQEKSEGTAAYYLGVPGIYSEKERMMAGLFGFTEFRQSGNERNRNFGYWFRKIEEV